MSAMDQSQQMQIQANFFDFALIELVLKNRDSFLPLWTLDSWVKFLIWLTLNCGLSGERESLELFVDALGPRLTGRMRRVVFERTVESLALQLIADPADSKVLIMPIGGALLVTCDQAEKLLDRVGLLDRVESDQCFWQELDAVIAIPWQSEENMTEFMK